MILEQAILDIKPGETAAFETTMQEAKAIISVMPGFIRLEVRPCVENDHRYLLLIEWQTLEDHTEGFRGSPEYEKWKALLHHFYAPFPTVEHYGEPVVTT
ncbi:antibiotic biosynthesis monooxygenase family protein [Kordiimonas sp.]|uniref:antibiotic biosynthesis monooxygenase family protein n=1 Tax=Kordiimonas sp. TaxID=1970157 RepID=UPI003A9523A3